MVKVLFVQDSFYEYYSVMLLSAILKKHEHKCEIVIGDWKEISQKIKLYKPDMIAISSMNLTKEWMTKTSKKIKGITNSPIIIGGPIVFSGLDTIKNKFIDAIVQGEGDETILEIANRIQNKKDFSNLSNLITHKNNSIKNIKYPTIQELDKLPFADREIYKNKQLKRKLLRIDRFFASRGCSNKCTFCFYNTLKSKYNYPDKERRRSVRNVIEEVESFKNKYSIRIIRFMDSIFTSNKKWLIKFLKEYRRKINLPFICESHYNSLDEEIIKELKKSNCTYITLGLESGDEYIRNKVLKKNVKTERVLKVAELLHKHKLRFCSLNMMALPGETFEQAIKTIRLNQKIKPYIIQTSIYLPYENLELTDYALRNNYLEEEKLDLLTRPDMGMMRSILSQKDIHKVSNLHKFSRLLIRYPILEPILIPLLKLPENRIFDNLSSIIAVLEWGKMQNLSRYKTFCVLIKLILSKFIKFININKRIS